MTDPEDLISEDLARLAENSGSDGGDMPFTGVFAALAGMNEREKEEFLLLYGPREVRKAIKERQKALEQAKKQNKS